MTSSALSHAKIPFLELQSAYKEQREALDEATHRVLSSGWYLLGREIEGFESEFASYTGSKHCIGVANGLDALTLVLILESPFLLPRSPAAQQPQERESPHTTLPSRRPAPCSTRSGGTCPWSRGGSSAGC